MTVSYGQSVQWTVHGGTDSISVSGYQTPEEARESAARMAYGSGYTLPKWWQFWRWGDTKIDPPTSEPK